MNRDTVLVALDREAADQLARGRASQDADADQFGAWLVGRDALRAALDTDREQQVGRLVDVGVKALEAVATGMHVNSVGGRRQQDAAAVVDAVLSVLEGADDE